MSVLWHSLAVSKEDTRQAGLQRDPVCPCQPSCAGTLARTHRYLCGEIGAIDLDTTVVCGNPSKNSGISKSQGPEAQWIFWRESKFTCMNFTMEAELRAGERYLICFVGFFFTDTEEARKADHLLAKPLAFLVAPATSLLLP